MFQQRQLNDVYQLMEVSVTAPFTIGSIAPNVGQHINVTCSIGGTGVEPAQFNLGDSLEVIFSSNFGSLAGFNYQAWPVSAGVAQIVFNNSSAGTITPNANGTATIIAKRITPQLMS
jgi:hypothetical protein